MPPTIFALIMVGIFSKLPGPKHINTSQSPLEKLKRIDFRGAFLLTTTVLSICLILDLGGSRIPWTSHWILALVGTAFVCSTAYVVFARSTPEPIFPIQLATQPVVFKHYLLILSQAIAFNALMVYVPVYFQVASLASTSEAGMFLVPAFLGNTIGGLFAGAFLRRSKWFKLLNLGALTSGLLSIISLWLFWNGQSSPWLALLTFPLGFGMGALFNSVFVGLATQVQEKDVAIATSGLFLFFNLGAVAGVSGGSAVFHSALRKWLGRLLSDVDGASEVCLPSTMSPPERTVGLDRLTVYCRLGSEPSRTSRTSKELPTLSGICLSRATSRLSTVFLVCYSLTLELSQRIANHFAQFSASPAMSSRWFSQPASKVSEGNWTVDEGTMGGRCLLTTSPPPKYRAGSA